MLETKPFQHSTLKWKTSKPLNFSRIFQDLFSWCSWSSWHGAPQPNIKLTCINHFMKSWNNQVGIALEFYSWFIAERDHWNCQHPFGIRCKPLPETPTGRPRHLVAWCGCIYHWVYSPTGWDPALKQVEGLERYKKSKQLRIHSQKNLVPKSLSRPGHWCQSNHANKQARFIPYHQIAKKNILRAGKQHHPAVVTPLETKSAVPVDDERVFEEETVVFCLNWKLTTGVAVPAGFYVETGQLLDAEAGCRSSGFTTMQSR